jgi:phosphoadenosine phosphosulfate reductase
MKNKNQVNLSETDLLEEPRFTELDREIWSNWKKECYIWSLTTIHNKRLQKARKVISEMYSKNPEAYVAFSGGKDSTIMLHMVAELLNKPKAMSVKDDMDYPGEEEYVAKFTKNHNVNLDIIKPDFSLQNWLSENAHRFDIDQDFHGRMTEFSDKAFYSLIDKYRIKQRTPGVYLGLRKYESKWRMLNRMKRGYIYTKKNGETICQPLVDFEGRDVYAYAFNNNIELLPVYRCVRLHKKPDLIRKSWWLPGSSVKHGGLYWLKIYYPSLYFKIRRWFPDAGVKT